MVEKYKGNILHLLFYVYNFCYKNSINIAVCKPDPISIYSTVYFCYTNPQISITSMNKTIFDSVVK